MAELFADIKRYNWVSTRVAGLPKPKHRRKHHRGGATGLPWQAGKIYRVNITVTSGGNTYTCLEAHTSGAGQLPAALPLLWQVNP